MTCVFVCVRVRARARARVCVCVRAQTNDYNHTEELNKAPTGIVWEVNNGVEGCEDKKKEEDVSSTRTRRGRKNTTRWLLCASGDVASKYCSSKHCWMQKKKKSCKQRYKQDYNNPVSVYICVLILLTILTLKG